MLRGRRCCSAVGAGRASSGAGFMTRLAGASRALVVAVVPVVPIVPSVPIVPVVPMPVVSDVPSVVPMVSAGISVVVLVVASSALVSASLPEHFANNANGAAVNKIYLFIAVAPWGALRTSPRLLFQFDTANAVNGVCGCCGSKAFCRTVVAIAAGMLTSNTRWIRIFKYAVCTR